MKSLKKSISLNDNALITKKQIVIMASILFIFICCHSSEKEQNYLNAINKIKQISATLQNNLKNLSDLNQQTGLLQKKVTDSKTESSQAKAYFSQIQSAIISETKNLENYQKQIQIKLDEYNNKIPSSLYEQKTNEINFLIIQTNKQQVDYQKTTEAITATISEIEVIINQKLKIN